MMPLYLRCPLLDDDAPFPPAAAALPDAAPLENLL